jgi:cyanophycinase
MVAGTSAGTDCPTNNTMISGGESYEGLAYGTQNFWRTGELPLSNNLTSYGPGGIGLFPHGLLDTHFANRGRSGRMLELMIDTRSTPVGSTRAFGIDENTAMVVTGPFSARKADIIGERGVLVLDISRASVAAEAKAISGVVFHRLSVGDSIDLNSLAVTPAADKQAMAGRETSDVAKTSSNVFAYDTFELDAIAQSLLSSRATATYGVTKETKPQFKVTLSKTRDGDASLLAKGYDGVHPTYGTYTYTYTDMSVSITTL